MSSNKIVHLFILSLLSILSLISCAEVTESTGKVLDSAGSITRSASEKAWISNPATPTPAAESNLY